MDFKPVEYQSKNPKYKQIQDQVLNLIRTKKLKKNDRLPTISQLIDVLKVNRRTIIKSFRILQDRGILEANERLGYFIINTNLKIKGRIFLLLDRLSAFREEVYYAFLEELGNEYVVDTYFYHFNFKIYSNLIKTHLKSYDFLVITTFLKEDPKFVLEKIPREKLILLDNLIPNISPGFSAVYQNFGKDLYNALKANISFLKKYQTIKMILPKTPYKIAHRSEALINFCQKYDYAYQITDAPAKVAIQKYDVLIVINDRDLVSILNSIKRKDYLLGVDVGIISYNDFPLKEFVAGGLTTLSTDFRKMGITAAQIIKKNQNSVIENPSSLVIRSSI